MDDQRGIVGAPGLLVGQFGSDAGISGIGRLGAGMLLKPCRFKRFDIVGRAERSTTIASR
jgi:hypothetical protein